MKWIKLSKKCINFIFNILQSKCLNVKEKLWKRKDLQLVNKILDQDLIKKKTGIRIRIRSRSFVICHTGSFWKTYSVILSKLLLLKNLPVWGSHQACWPASPAFSWWRSGQKSSPGVPRNGQYYLNVLRWDKLAYHLALKLFCST